MENKFDILNEKCKNQYDHIKNSRWCQSLISWIKYIEDLRGKVHDCSNPDDNFKRKMQHCEINNFDNFIECILKQDNGAGSISQGVMTAKDKQKFKQQATRDEICEILKEQKFDSAKEKVDAIFGGLNKEYNAIKHRFLRILFPEHLTPLDAKGQFDEFEKLLQNVYGITLVGDNKEEELLNKLNKCCNGADFESKAVKQIFVWELYVDLKYKNIRQKKAVIYYGAPGTGKTYKAKQNAKDYYYDWALRNGIIKKGPMIQVVQFHPSFSYEDFIEGIRPNNRGGFDVVDGVFRDFCKKAGEKEIELWKIKGFRDKFKDKKFCEITIEDVQNEIGENGENIVKNILGANIKENDLLEDVLEPAFFIIDEINRAELSKVFGELMYALEYRGYAGKIKTQYSYLRNSKNAFFWENGEDFFFLPHNVYIIGTMNTIDRSVDIFDFALRRRFYWQKFTVDYGIINNKGLRESLEKLNNKIKNEPLLGEDYEIGHAYVLSSIYCDAKDQKIKDYIWKNSIKPLLVEYLKGIADSKMVEDKINDFEKTWKNES